MTQKTSLPLSVRVFFKFSLLLIFAASILTLSSLSCSNNPADNDKDPNVSDSAAIADSLDILEAVAAGFIPIYTFQELCEIGKADDLPLDGRYMLMNDIDASPSRSLNNRRGFEPIGMRTYQENGVYSDNRNFTGEFDGRGRTIKNLYISRSDSAIVGMFGVISKGAKIRRLHIEADSIIGRTDVGGIVGRAENALIDSCSFKGDVKGRYWVGGIAGTAVTSTITRCISNGTVFSDTILVFGGAAGGLVGELNSSLMERSYSAADITGYYNVGGLAGHNYKSEITLSYAAGSVNGVRDSYIGGLAGNVYDGIVNQCYSTGKIIWVSSGKAEAGGLIGRVSRHSTVTDSYWDTSSSQISVSWGTVSIDTAIMVGGEPKDTTITVDGEPRDTTITVGGELRDTTIIIRGEIGIDTPRMMQQKTYVGWDFNTIWNIDEGKSTPYFMWHEKL